MIVDAAAASRVGREARQVPGRIAAAELRPVNSHVASSVEVTTVKVSSVISADLGKFHFRRMKQGESVCCTN